MTQNQAKPSIVAHRVVSWKVVDSRTAELGRYAEIIGSYEAKGTKLGDLSHSDTGYLEQISKRLSSIFYGNPNSEYSAVAESLIQRIDRVAMIPTGETPRC